MTRLIGLILLSASAVATVTSPVWRGLEFMLSIAGMLAGLTMMANAPEPEVRDFLPDGRLAHLLHLHRAREQCLEECRRIRQVERLAILIVAAGVLVGLGRAVFQ
jgi:hypothetical protein